jgi:hypothetical protein
MTTTTSRAAFGRIAGITLALIVSLCALGAPAAHGAGTTAANYTAKALTFYTGQPTDRCGGRGGDADDAGHVYGLCFFLRDENNDGTGDYTAPALVEYSDAGVVQKIGWLPKEYWFGANAPANYEALDVGVTPDGKTAYVTPGPNIDNLGTSPNVHPYTHQPLANGATTGAVLRLKRQADGSWLYDPSFRAGPFLIGGNYWSARRLAVDAQGRIYVSTNSVVYELSPANGAIVSSFGGGATTNGAGGTWVEGIDNAQGLSVSADGGTLFVVEQQHHIVQKWHRVGTTDWQRDTSFLLGRPSEEGDDLCGTNDHFQSPYDVGVDAAGDVYVLDTTCNRVQRFTKAGVFVQTVWQNRTNETLELSHGFAVSWQGNVLLPIERSLLVRSDPPSRPDVAPVVKPNCADRTAPRILGETAPRTTTTRIVTIAVRASDDCGITHTRVLGNRNGTPRWNATTKVSVALTGWNGRRTLVVQVKDKRGAVASKTIVIVLALPQPALHVRSVANVAGTGCRAGDPLQRINGGSSYVLVDRCAVLSGRVVKATQSGSSVTIEVLLPTATAQRIFDNAVGPVKILAITDGGTRVIRAIHTGRGIVVVGSVIATADHATAFAIPVDSIRGT